jgi:hypothetical protein
MLKVAALILVSNSATVPAHRSRLDHHTAAEDPRRGGLWTRKITATVCRSLSTVSCGVFGPANVVHLPREFAAAEVAALVPCVTDFARWRFDEAQ